MRRATMTMVMMALTLAGVATRARADLLNPADFSSLGTLSLSAGSYTINTTTDQLLDSSNKVVFQGVTSSGVAVFDFRSIGLSGVTINVSGSDPLALLSQGNISIGGGATIDLNGSNGGGNDPYGPGGSNGVGGPGSSDQGVGQYGSSAGGGFGGAGGSTRGAGGQPYGDLATQLVGGSGGAGGVGYQGGGGGGGGAIELSARGSITIDNGSISARGGAGGTSGDAGGGGSGGGIFLGAPSVLLSGTNALDISGGSGGNAYSIGGGGGGGGRILILADNSSEYSSSSSVFNLAGGSYGRGFYGHGDSGGQAGVLTLGDYPAVATPEPSTMILLATGLPLAAAYAAWRRRRMLALA